MTTFKQDEPEVKRIRDFESKIHNLQAENKALKESNKGIVHDALDMRLHHLHKIEEIEQSRDGLLEALKECVRKAELLIPNFEVAKIYNLIIQKAEALKKKKKSNE